MTRKQKKKPRTTRQKLPNLWEWAWNKLPVWLRPISLMVVIALIVATFLLGLAEKTKNVFNLNPEPTPTKTVMWSEPVAYHIVREYQSFNGCPDDIRISRQVVVDEYIASTSDNKSNKFRENSYPITPAMLVTNFWHSSLSEFDVLTVTKLSLEIKDYQPIKDFSAIALEMSTCASQLLPGAKVWRLNIDPRQKSYDVLHPRVTNPSTNNVVIPRGAPDGIGIEVNGLEPGIYQLSVIIEYNLNGHQDTTEPLLFSIAVPDERQVKNVYEFDFLGESFGPADPKPFLDEWKNISYKTNLVIEYYKMGETLEGLKGQYTYVINLGEDVDLTGWKLVKRIMPGDNQTVYFTFPQFILKSGSGIRIWDRDGNNNFQDLFGANSLPNNIADDEVFSIGLLDTNLGWITESWVRP